MKKIRNAGILLLLVLSLLLGACSPAGEEKDTLPETKAYAGFWYSADEESVLELSGTDQTAKFYLLYPGFYEYGKVETGEYTESDGILNVTLDGIAYTYTYYQNTDTISFTKESGTITFVRKTELPGAHPQYEFPDYASMSCETMITLGDYRKIDISKYAYQKGAVTAFTNFYGTETFPTITDRAAQDGDYVDIDYTGYLNDEKFEGGEAEGQKILISDINSYIDGFVAGIIGHTVGETFDVPLTFPEDYGSQELAGKAVIFRMKLNAIYNLPLTDEQVAGKKDTLGCETYGAYLDQCAKSASSELIWNELEKMTEFADGTIPTETYQYFYQYYCDYYHSAAKYYNTTYEKYLAMYGMTDDFLRTYAKKLATSYIIPYAIAEKENLTWTDEEYQKMYDSLVQKAMLQNEMDQAAAVEYVQKTQMKYLHAELTYSTVENWLIQTLLVKPESK